MTEYKLWNGKETVVSPIYIPQIWADLQGTHLGCLVCNQKLDFLWYIKPVNMMPQLKVKAIHPGVWCCKAVPAGLVRKFSKHMMCWTKLWSWILCPKHILQIFAQHIGAYYCHISNIFELEPLSKLENVKYSLQNLQFVGICTFITLFSRCGFCMDGHMN